MVTIQRRVATFCGAGFLAFCPGLGAAHADDWDFAEFGMTSDAVIAASGGKARPCQSKECNMARRFETTEAWMPVTMDRVNLTVGFNFDRETHRLIEITASLDDIGEADRFLRDMRTKYKAAYGMWQEKHLPWPMNFLVAWEWQRGDDLIQLQVVDENHPKNVEINIQSPECQKKMQEK